jgi:hypothetical protein
MDPLLVHPRELVQVLIDEHGVPSAMTLRGQRTGVDCILGYWTTGQGERTAHFLLNMNDGHLAQLLRVGEVSAAAWYYLPISQRQWRTRLERGEVRRDPLPQELSA